MNIQSVDNQNIFSERIFNARKINHNFSSAISKKFVSFAQNQDTFEKVQKNSLLHSTPYFSPANFIKGMDYAEFLRIRTPILGKVRNEDELSNKDIVNLINAELMTITKEEIEEILSHFPENDQKTALQIMDKLTQWGDIKSLDYLCQKISGHLLLGTEFPSMNSTMSYFRNQKHLFDTESALFGHYNKGVLIMDEVVIDNLKNNKEFLELIKTSKISPLILTGFNNGLNLFSQDKDLEAITKEILKKVKENSKNGEETIENEKLDAIINEIYFKELKELGIGKKIYTLSVKDEEKEPITVEKIAKNLNSLNFNEEKLEKILSEFDKAYLPYIREFLAQNVEILTFQSLGKRLKMMRDSLVKTNNGEDFYYYVPNLAKSYSPINFQNELVNKNIKCIKIEDLQALKEQKNKNKIVILDDMTGSGMTMSKEIDILKNNNVDIENITLAPVIATKIAYDELAGEKFVNVLTGNVKEKFNTTKYYKSLEENDKQKFDDLCIHKGCGGANTCIALPYMSPDNNNCVFAYFFAKNFVYSNESVKYFAKTEDMAKIMANKIE